jgi:mitochondrial fission protein ELM1
MLKDRARLDSDFRQRLDAWRTAASTDPDGRARPRRLLIVAGPYGAGKSTLLEQFMAGALPHEITAALPSSARRWVQTSGRKIHSAKADAETDAAEGLILHYNILRPSIRGFLDHESDPVLEILRVATDAIALTLRPPLPQLVRQFVARSLIEQAQLPFVSRLWKWVVTCLGARGRATSQSIAEPPAARRLTGRYARVYHLYQQPQRLDEHYDRWACFLQSQMEKGPITKNIWIAPIDASAAEALSFRLIDAPDPARLGPKPYRMLLLKDSRPGHYRKSEGVAKAIARKLPVEISELHVEAPRFLPSRALRALPKSRALAPLLLKMIWQIRAADLPRPDLIISTGADTLVPNALLASFLATRNIFIGTVRELGPQRFSAILSARPELAGRPNHLIVLSPSGVDPDRLARPVHIASVAHLAGRTFALLVGGPTPDHSFVDADWQALRSLIESASEAGAHWLVTSSRRTPAAVADRLAAIAAALPAHVRFFDYRRESTGSIDPLFNADAILVSEDSNTMISEAVAARRPVIVLRPARVRSEMGSLRRLQVEGRIGIMPMQDATLGRLVAEIGAIIPLSRNPLDVLYELLVEAGVVPAPSPATRPGGGASASR